MSDRPNVILICADQFRRDCLSSAGHPVVHTPTLDALALRGVRMTRAYSACPTCIAARAGLLTGLAPASHGRVGYRDGVPWDYEATLAGEFTRHGYQTQAVGKMHVFPERSQMGFQNVVLHDGFLHHVRDRHPDLDRYDDYLPWLRAQTGRPDADYFDHGLNCNSWLVRPWDKEEYLHPTNWVISQGIDFLRRRDPRKPFFLFLSFVRPHPPFDPPQHFLDQYLQAQMPPPPMGDWTDLLAPYAQPLRFDCAVGLTDPARVQRARAGYYALITHLDHQINRFVENLSAYAAMSNTIVAFTSDHGELLGDHGLFRKSLPYEGSAAIPLIVAGPPGLGLRPGSTVDRPAELRDVLPTLLDCAGLPPPEGLDGRSLLPLLRGQPVPWRSYLHIEHNYAGHQSVHAIVDEQFKYVWYSALGAEQLFDMQGDHQELHNMAGDAHHSAAMAEYRGRLIAELDDREEGFVQDGWLVTGRPVKANLDRPVRPRMP